MRQKRGKKFHADWNCVLQYDDDVQAACACMKYALIKNFPFPLLQANFVIEEKAYE